MAISRRQFLQGAALAGASLVLPFKWNTRRAYAFSQSPIITKFNTALPGLGPTGIPLATKSTQTFAGLATDVYNLGVAEFTQQIPGLPGPTHFWGYHDFPAGPQRYLGGVIVATRGTPVLLTVTNQLPNHQIIPIDPTIMAGPPDKKHPMGLTVGDLPLNRHATHLHGGLTPWISDGTPFQWYTPGHSGYQNGVSFTNVPGTNPPKGTATYYYPMDQSARLVWYHDHAIGITRTNAYSGIASGLVITDAFEQALVGPGGILQGLFPGIPLIVQDKTFLDTSKDPNYPLIQSNIPPAERAQNGDLWYPWDYEKDSLATGRWAYGPEQTPPANIPNPTLPPIAEIPEFFADTALINGAPYPTLTVKTGTFRLRLLNGSQARFWHLNLYEEIGTTGEADTSKPGPTMYQIGTEGGFLPAVAPHDNTLPRPLDPSDQTGNTFNPDGPFNLLLAPAERADLIINFPTNGKSYILYNDAPAPFPGGDPRNDYYTGDPDFTNAANNTFGLSGGAFTTQPLQGPNTRTIMKIVVDNSTGVAGSPFPNMVTLSQALKQNFTGGNPVAAQQPPLLYSGADAATPGLVPYTGPVNRNLTLNEDFDDFGRLIQREGTTVQLANSKDGLNDGSGNNNQGLPTWGRGYLDDPTETPNVGAVEVWNIYNLTGDTHPIHFHLVNVQVIQRAQFDVGDPTTDPPTPPTFTPNPGTERLPDLNEYGWKETVRMNPGEVTTVIMKFDLPKVPFTVNPSISTDRGINGNEYVWHCHILEHEEHDMMRPLVVIGPNPLAVVPESQTLTKGNAKYEIVNGVPPYTIITSNPKYPPAPATIKASGNSFTVAIGQPVTSTVDVTYKITDSAGTFVNATLTINPK